MKKASWRETNISVGEQRDRGSQLRGHKHRQHRRAVRASRGSVTAVRDQLGEQRGCGAERAQDLERLT